MSLESFNPWQLPGVAALLTCSRSIYIYNYIVRIHVTGKGVAALTVITPPPPIQWYC